MFLNDEDDLAQNLTTLNYIYKRLQILSGI